MSVIKPQSDGIFILDPATVPPSMQSASLGELAANNIVQLMVPNDLVAACFASLGFENITFSANAPLAPHGNDYWFNTTNHLLYIFNAASGAFVLNTQILTQGGKANAIMGVGAPTASNGIDGDWYLDAVSQKVYGPRANGVWPTAPVCSLPMLDGSGKIPVAQLPDAVIGAMKYAGAWNASTNTPAIASGVGTLGYAYKVSVAGTTAIDGVSQWSVGDYLIFNGSAWDKFDGNASDVVNVVGLTGAITKAALNAALGLTNVATSGSASDIQSGILPVAQLPLAGAATAGAVIVSNGLTNANGTISVTYGTAANTAAQGNDARIVGALQAATAALIYAPLASPALTGSPTAPTAAANDNSTLIATTAFVKAAITMAAITTALGYTPPQPDGTGATGTWSINVSGNAATASSVAWSNVSGRPTNVSSFVNDSGYLTAITGAQIVTALGYTPPKPDGTGATGTWPIGISGNAATASSVAWANVSGRPTAVSAFSNDAGYLSAITAAQIVTALGYTPPKSDGTGATGTWAISISGNATSATTANSVAWSNVSGRPTNISTFTNDANYISQSPSSATASAVRTAYGIDSYVFRNRLRNATFAINQRYVSGTVSLVPGQYGHDGVKGGSAGCTYTFTTSGVDTAINVTAGSLILPIESTLIEGGVYTLSQAGTAQARIWQGTGTTGSGSYTAAPFQTSSLAAAMQTNVEFSTGTILRPQMESGSLATAFERRPIGVELQICQRYFQTTYEGAAQGAANASGQVTAYFAFPISAGGYLNWTLPFPVQMRAIPTMTCFAQSTGSSGKASVNSSDTAWALNASQGRISSMQNTSTSATPNGFNINMQYSASAEI